jgi:hypothetical protein
VVKLPTSGSLESSVVFVLVVGFSEAYEAGMLSVCYHSINIFCILPHVKFKVGLPIWILQNRASRHKKVHLEIAKFVKKLNVLEDSPTYFTSPAFFKRMCAWQSVKTWCAGACQSFQDEWDIFKE